MSAGPARHQPAGRREHPEAARRGLHRGPAVRAGVRPRLQDLLLHGEWSGGAVNSLRIFI